MISQGPGSGRGPFRGCKADCKFKIFSRVHFVLRLFKFRTLGLGVVLNSNLNISIRTLASSIEEPDWRSCLLFDVARPQVPPEP